MASVRDRLSQYQAAAAATATFDETDASAEATPTDAGKPSGKVRVQPRRREHDESSSASQAARKGTDATTATTGAPGRSNTPLIIRRARDYEQKVKDLRADQENPAAKQKSHTSKANTRTERVDRSRTRTGAGSNAPSTMAVKVSKPPRNNTPLIVRKARDYEQSVKALRADQDTPGVMAKMKNVTQIKDEPAQQLPSVTNTTDSTRPTNALPRRNTPLIIRKARDYEQKVKDLQADQENPGALARLQSIRGDTVQTTTVDRVESEHSDEHDSLQRTSTGKTHSRNSSTGADAVASSDKDERNGVARSNTPLIIRKARDYEQRVRDLRADQEKPGLLDRNKSQRNKQAVDDNGDDNDDDDDDDRGVQSSTSSTGDGKAVSNAGAAPLRSNTPLIVRRARDYEQSVKDLLADQEKPGLRQKLKSMRERGEHEEEKEVLQDLAKVATRRSTPPSVAAPAATQTATPAATSVTVDKVSNASLVEDDSGTSKQERSKIRLDDLGDLQDGDFSEDDVVFSEGSSKSVVDPDDAPISLTADLVMPNELPMSAPKLDEFPGTFIGNTGSKSAHVRGLEHTRSMRSAETGSSFHSAPDLLRTGGSALISLPSSEWSDGFDSLTSEESEGIVLLEDLLGGHEFTNDAVHVEEEELPPGEYLDAARRGEMDYTTSPSSSGHAKTLSMESLPSASGRAPDRVRGSGPNRPGRRVGGDGGGSVAPISSPLPLRRGDTGRPVGPVSLTVDLEVEEDAGVRNGWRREQSDRLPKAKVVIARRRSGELGRTMSASAASIGEGRQLVKQYKDRSELLEGRVSRVDVRASRLTAREREEKARRHAAGVARRSSLVSGAIDRVSMAADPFIDFMADRGGVMPGPKKPRGKLGKLLRKLFKGNKKRERELLKQG